MSFSYSDVLKTLSYVFLSRCREFSTRGVHYVSFQLTEAGSICMPITRYAITHLAVGGEKA